MGTVATQVVVDGRVLALECRYGDVEFSTIWPGGSDACTWTLGTQPTHRYRGGETVAVVVSGLTVWAGFLNEPDPSQDQMTATGAFYEGQNYAALTSGGAAGTGPNQSIDQAIIRGLRWTRPTSISASAVDIDVSQGPVTVTELLDTYANNNTVRWGVDPYRQVYATADDTLPTYQTFPLSEGLGFSLERYASVLIGRYLDSATSTYKTVTLPDANAVAAHGTVEQIVDLTPRGAITSTKATTFLGSLLALGKSTPQWTADIPLSYGELLNNGGSPACLETVQAGRILRVHGGYELAQRLNGAMYLDVPIGRTNLAAGVLTITPAQMATTSLTDALTLAVTRKK